MSILTDYYNAIEAKDYERLESLLYEPLFGIRTYEEKLLFSKEELLKEIKHNTYPTIEIHEDKKIHKTIHAELRINDLNVIVKAEMKKGKIIKIYETIDTFKTRLKCLVTYDGSSFFGFQKQDNTTNTIQESMEKALTKGLKETIILKPSGRTDKGVHAIKQVIHFDTTTKIPIKNLKPHLNKFLVNAIHIKKITEVPITFHARFDAVLKHYMYKINTNHYNPIQRQYEWYVSGLSARKVKKELKRFLGTHDFQAFTKTTKKDTIRTVKKINVKKHRNYLEINIIGPGFLRYMVRNMIGVAVYNATHEDPISIAELFTKKSSDLHSQIAPAAGLYLKDVSYTK
ncbi:MAG: tRNA pseudouridine(38-40) synthase TruA [Candidatus Izimaplasma sp.]|nr:tRNA pseudouridine(38-40) synthase TruA [Candidatus Izimaplasma bacterium]